MTKSLRILILGLVAILLGALTSVNAIAADPLRPGRADSSEIGRHSYTQSATVVSVTPLTIYKDSTPVGTTAGAVTGGVVGHQFGKGRGKTAATALGVFLGAAAGHKIEKNNSRHDGARVIVRYDGGHLETITVGPGTYLQKGDRVFVTQDYGKKTVIRDN